MCVCVGVGGWGGEVHRSVDDSEKLKSNVLRLIIQKQLHNPSVVYYVVLSFSEWAHFSRKSNRLPRFDVTKLAKKIRFVF